MLIFAFAPLILKAPLIETEPDISIDKPCNCVTLEAPPNFTVFVPPSPLNAAKAPPLPTNICVPYTAPLALMFPEAVTPPATLILSLMSISTSPGDSNDCAYTVPLALILPEAVICPAFPFITTVAAPKYAVPLAERYPNELVLKVPAWNPLLALILPLALTSPDIIKLPLDEIVPKLLVVPASVSNPELALILPLELISPVRVISPLIEMDPDTSILKPCNCVTLEAPPNFTVFDD